MFSVPWPRWLVTGFPLWRTLFNSRPVYVESAVDVVLLALVSLPILPSVSVSYPSSDAPYSILIICGWYSRDLYSYCSKELSLPHPHPTNNKGHPATGQGVPGRLRPRIFLTFGTTRVVGRQPYAPAAFTPGDRTNPWYSLSEAESTSGHMVPSGGGHGKNPQ